MTNQTIASSKSLRRSPGVRLIIAPVLLCLLLGCNDAVSNTTADSASGSRIIKPVVITETVPNDSDDPAIWINKADPSGSLVIGTDKAENGGLYVFDLDGKIDHKRSVTGLRRPNNVDIEYGLMLGGKPVDIAVTTERLTHKLRMFTLPGMEPVDNGGIPVFKGETQPEYRDLMGIGLYRNRLGKIYAIVGRKTGPANGTYLWQYLLEDDGQGKVKATLVRKFGKYSGVKEIESIVVDDKLGYVYYSDEGTGIRKYFADPEKGNGELALFARQGFTADHEGLSIYETSDTTGFILASDQQANQFQVFCREGSGQDPHAHKLVKTVKVLATESDGSEVVSVPLGNKYPKGLFVAMSDNKTFHYYDPRTLLGSGLLKMKGTDSDN